MQKPTAATASADSQLPWPLIVVALGALGLSLLLTVPNDPEWWKVVVLGVVQGITEWLPISSTGHLLIVSELLGYTGSIGGTFEIFIQLGTVVSVVAFYQADLRGQLVAVLGRSSAEAARATRRFWLAILIAFVPAAAVGLLLRDLIKRVLFETPTVIAAALIVGGVIFLLIELGPRRTATTRTIDKLSPWQALWVGIAQIFALIPGMSRSGSSIIGGLLAGLDRQTATTFSFYLAIPTLGAATLVDLVGSLDLIQPADWGRLLLGAVVAMIVGYLTIGWLLRYLAHHNFVVFGIYRIIVGGLILALAAVGMLA